MFRKVTTVIQLGEDCEVIDWKQSLDEVLKRTTDWHFQFLKSKKIVFRRNKTLTTVLVRGEPFYNFKSGKGKTLCRRGKTLKNIRSEKVSKGIPVKSAKLDDVKRLLELHFGE
uniref:Uncharacterized protein n=1 Tax=Homalodisca liturata TaxID=320908 RepID=A0A1B6JFZ5_9HEMI